MAITAALKSFSELMENRYIIPAFQRGYELDDQQENKRVSNFVDTILQANAKNSA